MPDAAACDPEGEKIAPHNYTLKISYTEYLWYNIIKIYTMWSEIRDWYSCVKLHEIVWSFGLRQGYQFAFLLDTVLFLSNSIKF